MTGSGTHAQAGPDLVIQQTFIFESECLNKLNHGSKTTEHPHHLYGSAEH